MASDFETNLLRVTAAAAHAQLAMTIAREMFGKSFFALGVQERSIVDGHVVPMLGYYYGMLTPEGLQAQTRPPMGFQSAAPASPPPQSPPTPPGER